jgi:hypothetical protein
MLKVCSCCSRPAGYSLAFVLSTLGTSGRLQQCSKVTLFCDRWVADRAQSRSVCEEVLWRIALNHVNPFESASLW